MALTYNRPGATAADLNAAYAGLRATLAPKLPTRLRDRLLDGTVVFDTSALIDLDEDDEEADCVESLDDLPRALVDKANRAWLRGRWSVSRDGTSWKVSVNETRSILPTLGQVGGVGVLISSSGSVASDPLHATATFEPTGGGSYTVDAVAFLVASPEGAAPGVVGAWEQFDGTGYSEWDAGDVFLVGLVERFGGTGYSEWGVGSAFLLGAEETAWTGWPNGVVPIIPVEAGTTINVVTGDFAVEDLTSQVDGSTTTFVLPEYVAGSVRLYLNGSRLVAGSDFTETSSTEIEIVSITPTPPDTLTADYVPCTC